MHHTRTFLPLGFCLTARSTRKDALITMTLGAGQDRTG